MGRHLHLVVLAVVVLATSCATEPSEPPQSSADAQVIEPMLDGGNGGALEDHITIPNGPRDAAITEPTPVLDLPLVVGRPSGPLSSASLDVLVLDVAGEPVRGVGVTAGGPVTLSNALGIAHVSAVYGAGTSDVFTLVGGYALTHAQIAIREGETSSVVLTVVPIVARASIEDEARPGTIMLEGADSQTIASISFADAPFVLPWGGAPTGGSSLGFALLDAPAQASAVPGNMRAQVGGALLGIAGVMSFELRVLHGATPVVLRNAAQVRLAWPAWASELDPAAQTLYRFDPKAGAFVQAGSLQIDEAEPGFVTATIDELGHWLIGTSVDTGHCARLHAQQGGVALAYGSAQLTSATSLSAARVELDAQGEGCTALPVAGAARVTALGRVGTAMSRASGDAMASTEPTACASECTPTSLEAQPIDVACVRGTVETTLPFVSASIVDPLVEWSETIATGREFCLEVPAGAQLSIAAGGIQCGAPSMVVASQGAACAADGCLDLGTIPCCGPIEGCAPPGTDDDCDGVVDEGCTCGSQECTTTVAGCCAADVCGEHSAITDECIALSGELFLPSTSCPSAQVPVGNGDTTSVSGCCLMSGVCGLMWESRFVCIPPADVARVWGDAVTAPNTSCTP